MTVAPGKKDFSIHDRLGSRPLPQHKKPCKYWLNTGQCSNPHCRYEHTTALAATKTKQFLAPQAKKLLSNHLVPTNNKRKPLSNKTWKNTDYKQPVVGNNGTRGPLKQQQPQEQPRKRLNRSNIATNVTKGPIHSDLLQPQKEASVSREDTSIVKEGSISILESQKDKTVDSSIDDTKHRQCGSPVKEGSPVCTNKSESSHGSGLTQLATLKGHEKTIAGIALPCGSTTLYTVSKDKCIRAWDCHTGQCTGTENLEGEVRCIISKGPWFFVGLPNNVKAWNTQDNVKCSLSAVGGHVQSLEFDNDILFAGMENGNILVWRWNHAAIDFELATTLKGHSGPVHSLVIGSGHGKLYSVSGSSIKVWDQTLQCTQTINGHSKQVTSIVCWDRYLLSISLDKTLKIWAAAESGSMEMVYMHEVDQGIIAMSIMDQPEARHLLLSLEDKSLRLYDFPSFTEKGRVYSKEQSVVSHSSGNHSLYFTGDAAGDVSVWKLCSRE